MHMRLSVRPTLERRVYHQCYGEKQNRTDEIKKLYALKNAHIFTYLIIAILVIQAVVERANPAMIIPTAISEPARRGTTSEPKNTTPMFDSVSAMSRNCTSDSMLLL